MEIPEPKREQNVQLKHLLEYLSRRSNVLLSRGGSVFTFAHRTFQDFLTACHLTKRELPSIAEELDRVDYGTKKEMTIAGCGNTAYGEQSGLQDLLEKASYRNPAEHNANLKELHGEHLIDFSSYEKGDLHFLVKPKEGDRLRSNRNQKYHLKILKKDKHPLVERVASGSALAHLGDPRFRSRNVWHLPADKLLGFVKIPAGPFTMGEGRDQHQLYLSDYFIGCYPVTTAQFRDFVADSRHRPKKDKCIDGFNNHPVAFVTWHDAMAYCEWLTKKLRNWEGTPKELAGLMRGKKSAWRIILPSEAEWEKAARGSDGRKFPWGNKADFNLANYDKTHLGATSAVGCFPGGKSPYGCLDMAGNVWEWTRSLEKKYPYVPNDGRENLEEKNEPRVLRGGSFNFGELHLRCSLRSWLSPDFAYSFFGFRVVLSEFSYRI
jgi:formylglycine-generating enzyme required for sulfatase activity